MKTVKEAAEVFKQELTPLYDAFETEALQMLAVSEITGLSRAKIKAFPEIEINTTAQQKLNEVLQQLKTGKPLQYILGYEEFYGLRFEVNPSVLIPRPETEELVSWILESVNSIPSPAILDIGTGSGCIPVTLKHLLSAASVSSIDVSPEALQTAQRNAAANQVAVNFIQQDILAADLSALPTNLDVIVSNPPYVTVTDKAQMHQNVTDFEPHLALFVPENDPLIFYKAIADYALTALKTGGLLFFEINESYGEQTAEILSDKEFKNIELRKDIRGKDRMMKAIKGD
ncbi:peptide chain release factor N(5)-glutamine methyltransferase [Mucilaginibacter sp. RS28]|uniref:Release factor glutamine methyltransferase n=1 Tax=Mucilaginibacter straminoryzae TaxID=2932774 RepID=A0A9X1X7J4_9SPHI|nr:peptide chain release factor N(5)-glutamine methyltransferase [Mucilaginibacter straminoryzae]MCJ8211138.1 peptide chain release factor N(5)-glutamine methyltransferase [Mucilaginibacter straminoryzae]